MRFVSKIAAILLLLSLSACSGETVPSVPGTAAPPTLPVLSEETTAAQLPVISTPALETPGETGPSLTQPAAEPSSAETSPLPTTREPSSAPPETLPPETPAQTLPPPEETTTEEAVTQGPKTGPITGYPAVFPSGSRRQSTAVPPSSEDYLSGRVPDYGEEENWAYLAIGEEKPADLFFVGPTVIDEGVYLALSDKQNLHSYFFSLEQERGIYEAVSTLYAPYYRQMAAEVYAWPGEEQAFWRDQAFRDVAAAFRYYLEHYDIGKPLILAGFSQGAELCLRLMREFFDPASPKGAALLDRLVAVYAIGAGLPEKMVEEYPWLKPAEEETDTGVIISFDCEQSWVTDSVLLPAGSRSLSINPLSWSRDLALADKSLNKGACFMRGPAIFSEIPALCGCYIEPERGALVVTDINPEHYPSDTFVLPEGNLHSYDYQFFYRNLQENVGKRVEAFLNR